VNDEFVDVGQGTLQFFGKEYATIHRVYFTIYLSADLWGLIVTFHCALQSVDFPLTGRPSFEPYKKVQNNILPTIFFPTLLLSYPIYLFVR